MFGHPIFPVWTGLRNAFSPSHQMLDVKGEELMVKQVAFSEKVSRCGKRM